MKNFIKKYDGDLGTIGLILVLLFTEYWEDNFEMTLTVVAIVLLSIQLILSVKKKLTKWNASGSIKPRQVAGFFVYRHLGLSVLTFTLLEDSL